MLCICVALSAEAAPLIEHFKLRKDISCSHLELFSSDSIRLAVSGMGKIAAAIAVTTVLLKTPKRQVIGLLNLGICGSKKEIPVGSALFVNKVRDSDTGRHYLPDLHFTHGLREAALVTTNYPARDDAIFRSDECLVDMEAAGFFEAGLRFLSPSNVACIKIVSDHLQTDDISKEFVSGLLNKNLHVIDSYLQRFHSLLLRESGLVLSAEDLDLLDQLCARLKFTTSQQEMLYEMAVAAYLRGSSLLPILLQYLNTQCESARDRSRTFNSIRELLSS